MLLTLAGLILADGYITQFVVNSGLCRESNPIMQNALSHGYFMPVKMAGSSLVVLLLWSIYKQQPKMAVVASGLSVLIYSGIVYWNIAGALIALHI